MKKLSRDYYRDPFLRAVVTTGVSIAKLKVWPMVVLGILHAYSTFFCNLILVMGCCKQTSAVLKLGATSRC